MSKYENKYNLISTSEKILFDILLELERITGNRIELGVGEIESVKKVIKPKAICKHCGKTHDRPVDYMNCGRKKKE